MISFSEIENAIILTTEIANLILQLFWMISWLFLGKHLFY